jgi:hypothetical protein
MFDTLPQHQSCASLRPFRIRRSAFSVSRPAAAAAKRRLFVSYTERNRIPEMKFVRTLCISIYNACAVRRCKAIDSVFAQFFGARGH